MSIKQQFDDEGISVARREHDEGVTLVADFGAQTAASVDVVGETVIVVTDDDQHEIDVAGDAQAFIRNGILTIEVEG